MAAKCSIPFVCLILYNGLSYGATDFTKSTAQRQFVSSIYQIDRKVKNINHNLASHKTVVKELITGTDRGGELTASIKNHKIVKLRIIIGVSSRQNLETFYFIDKKRLMVVDAEQIFHWNDARSDFDVSKYTTQQTKYYFINRTLLGWRNNQERRIHRAKDKGSLRKAAQLLKEAIEYSKIAHSSKREVDIEKFRNESS